MGFLEENSQALKTEEDNEVYREMLAERQQLQNELKSFEVQLTMLVSQ